MAHDFRFEKDALAGLSFSVCGLGNSLYTEHFNTVAIELDRSFSSLHANRISPLYCCDENTVKSKHSSLEGDVEFWENNFFDKLSFYLKSKNNIVLKKQVSKLTFLLLNYLKKIFFTLCYLKRTRNLHVVNRMERLNHRHVVTRKIVSAMTVVKQVKILKKMK